MELKDRLAVISGASSGIGAATAQAMAAAGARVVLLARTEERLAAVAETIQRHGGRAAVFAVDLSDLVAATTTAERILQEVGQPDILFNNAGAGRWLAVEETTPAQAQEMVTVPYLAAFALTRAFIPAMLDRQCGIIVNITSPAGYTPFPGTVAYSTARWAMRGFSEALRADLQQTGVKVIHMVAGLVDSGYFDHNPGSIQRLPSAARLVPTLQSEQVAAAVVQAIQRESREVIIPLNLRLLMFAQQHFPRLIQALVNRTGWRRQ